MNAGLAAFLRARRAALGLSARDVAESAGVTWQRIANMESRGEYRFPSPDELRRLAVALDTTPRTLLEAAGYLDPEP